MYRGHFASGAFVPGSFLKGVLWLDGFSLGVFSGGF